MTGPALLACRVAAAMKGRWPSALWIIRHGQRAGNVARDALTPAIAAGVIAIGGYQSLFALGTILAIAGGVAALFIRVSR